MNKPKLREGAERLITALADKQVSDDYKRAGVSANADGQFWVHKADVIIGIKLALANLHKLLEPREQPLVNGKRVAIVEVE